MPFFLGFKPGEIGRMVVESVVQEHAGEAAFQWRRRARAVRSPKYALKDLAELDNRVDAHVDGLRVAGERAWVECEENLANGPGEMFAATAFVLRAEPDQTSSGLNAILAHVEANPELQAGLVSGIGFSAWSRVNDHAQSWLESDVPFRMALGLAAFRVHRRAPPEAALLRALAVSDNRVRQEAIRLIGELGLERSASALPPIPEGPDRLRFLWARSHLFIQRAGPAMPVLRALADEDGPEAQPAAELLVRRLDERLALEWIRRGLGRLDCRRRAVFAAGAVGYPRLMDELMSLMEDDTMARAAGFAFTLLTGADLEFLDLNRDPPVPLDEDVDEIVEDPDEELPWPHVARVRDWWTRNKKGYHAGQRYLMGQPVERTNLERVLASGKQPHRRAAALELALLDAKTPLYPTSKPGREQARELLGWP